MNAPFQIAQADAGKTSAAPQLIRLTKPADGQAVTVKTGVDGKVKLDFSAIADERITIVRVGETAVIFFHDNKSTITLDPFFGSDGLPLALLEFDLGGNRIFSAEQIAAILPFTVYQGILPAAGEGGGDPQNAGANFNPTNIEGLPPIVLNDLLPPTELAGTFGFIEQTAGLLTPSGPITGPNDPAAADEDNVTVRSTGNNNTDSPGDDDQANLTGTLNFTVFAPGPFTVTFASMSGPVLDQNGTQVTSLSNPVFYVWDGAAGILYLTTDQNDPAAGAVVIVRLNTATGEYEIEMVDQFDHPLTGDPSNPGLLGFEDDVLVQLTYTVTDSLNRTATGTLGVGFDDDMPVLTGGFSRQVVNEDDIFNANSIGTSPFDGPGDLSLTEPFTGAAYTQGELMPLVRIGADEYPAQHADPSRPLFAFTQDAIDYMIGLGLSSKHFAGSATDNGIPLIYSITASGNFTVLTAYEPDPNVPPGATPPFNLGATGNIVFELRIDQFTGYYEFRLFDELVHAIDPANPKNIGLRSVDPVTGALGFIPWIDFGQIVTFSDYDRDAIKLVGPDPNIPTFAIIVVDDAPVAVINLVYAAGIPARVQHDETAGVQFNPFSITDPDRDTANQDVVDIFSAIPDAEKGNDPDVDDAAKIDGAIGYARSVLAAVTNLGSQVGSDSPPSFSAFSLTIDLTHALGTDSGLEITGGGTIVLEQFAPDLIIGRVDDAASPFDGQIAFAIHIDQIGRISIAQYLSIDHPDPNTGDEHVTLGGNVRAVYTLVDSDGDEDSDSVAIGQRFRFDDDGPVVTGFQPDSTTPLDDEDIVNPDSPGNQGTPGNGDDGALTVATGRLLFSAGSDGLAAITFAENLDIDAVYVDGDGNGTVHPVDSIVWHPGENALGPDSAFEKGGTLVGIMNVPNVGPVTVFTLEVDSDGNYVFTLLRPLGHPDQDDGIANNGTEESWEDNLLLDFEFTVTDGDGDSDDGTLVINVDDDTPEGSADPIDIDLTAGSFAQAQLHISPGADGLGGITLAGNTPPAGLTSNGDPVQYWISDDGLTLVAYTGAVVPDGGTPPSNPVFTLTVDPANGQYSFESFEPIAVVTPGPPADVTVASHLELFDLFQGVHLSRQGSLLKDAGGENLALVSGWYTPSMTNSAAIDAWKASGTPPSDLTLENANENDFSPLGFGVGLESGSITPQPANGAGNEDFDNDEFLRFDFGPVTDYDGPGGYLPEDNTNSPPVLAQVIAAQFHLNNFPVNTTLHYVVHYVGQPHTSGMVFIVPGEDTLRVLNIPALTGNPEIDYIEFFVEQTPAGPITSEGSIKLHQVTKITETAQTDGFGLDFDLAVSDGDGDTVTPVLTVNIQGLPPVLSPESAIVEEDALGQSRPPQSVGNEEHVQDFTNLYTGTPPSQPDLDSDTDTPDDLVQDFGQITFSASGTIGVTSGSPVTFSLNDVTAGGTTTVPVLLSSGDPLYSKGAPVHFTSLSGNMLIATASGVILSGKAIDPNATLASLGFGIGNSITFSVNSPAHGPDAVTFFVTNTTQTFGDFIGGFAANFPDNGDYGIHFSFDALGRLHVYSDLPDVSVGFSSTNPVALAELGVPSGLQDPRVVLTLEVGPVGSYDVAIFDQLDHHAFDQADHFEDTIEIDLGGLVTATNANGSATLDDFTVEVIDDVPVQTGNGASAIVDQDAIGGGSGSSQPVDLSFDGATNINTLPPDLSNTNLTFSGGTGIAIAQFNSSKVVQGPDGTNTPLIITADPGTTFTLNSIALALFGSLVPPAPSQITLHGFDTNGTEYTEVVTVQLNPPLGVTPSTVFNATGTAFAGIGLVELRIIPPQSNFNGRVIIDNLEGTANTAVPVTPAVQVIDLDGLVSAGADDDIGYTIKTFQEQPFLLNGNPVETAAGQAILIESDGTTLIGHTGNPSDPVFTLTLSGTEATFTLFEPLDLATFNALSLDFSSYFRAFDFDGDGLELSAGTVLVHVASGPFNYVALDEDDLPLPSSLNPTHFGNNDTAPGDDLPVNSSSQIAGMLQIPNAGAGEFPDFSALAAGNPPVLDIHGNHLHAGGLPLYYDYFGGDDILFATTYPNAPSLQEMAAASSFTVVVDDSNPGAYRINLHGPIDHPSQDDPSTPGTTETLYEDNVVIDLAYTYQDTSGNTVTGILRVNIDDDSPILNIHDNAPAEVVEGTSVQGTWSHGIGGDGGTYTIDIGGSVHDFANETHSSFHSVFGTQYSFLIDKNGNWEFSLSQYNNSMTPTSVTFTITLTDGDGDTVSDSHTLTFVADPARLRIEGAIRETVEEEHLDPTLSGPHQITVTGNDDESDDATPPAEDEDAGGNLALTQHTVSGVMTDDLTFTGLGGTPEFRIYAFPAAFTTIWASGNPLTSGGDPVHATRVSATELMGYVPSDPTGRYTPGDKVVFTLVITDQTTGAYTFTLFHNLDHPLNDIEDSIGIDFGGLVEVADLSQAGDTRQIENFVIDVIDDVPLEMFPDNATVDNAAGSTFEGALDYFHKAGADGPGQVVFVDTNPADNFLRDANGDIVTSGGHNVVLSGFGTTVLEGHANGVPVLRITLNPDNDTQANDRYTVEILQELDAGSSSTPVPLAIGGLSNASRTYKALDNVANDIDVLFSATDSSGNAAQVNKSTHGIGANSQGTGPGEVIRMDFAAGVNVPANPANNTFTLDEHRSVNGVQFGIAQTNPAGSSVGLIVRVFNADDDGKPVGGGSIIQGPIGNSSAWHTDGDDTPVAISQILINGSADPLTWPVGVTVTPMGNEFVISGLRVGDTVKVIGANDYNRIEIENDASDSFDVGNISFDLAGAPGSLSFTADLALTDDDGDTVQSGLNVVVGGSTPAPVPPSVNPLLPGVYYAFTNNALSPNDIAFDANQLFTGSNPLTFQFTLAAGNASWLTVTNGAAGTVTANDMDGIGPNAASGATIFRIDATDTVTGLTSYTYVAFTALNGTTFGMPGYDQNNANLYNGSGFPGGPVGNNGNVYIAAAGGSTMTGGNFGDAFYGSDNVDIINGQSANSGGNYIFAGGGDDQITGGNHRDVILGGDGNDTINAGDGDDILLGGDGNDILNGQNGNDFIHGGAGQDTMNGGLHDDVFYYLSPDELSDVWADIIQDFDAVSMGNDEIHINAANFGFGALTGTLTGANASLFASGADHTSAGVNSDVRFFYETSTNVLWYDGAADASRQWLQLAQVQNVDGGDIRLV